MHRHVGICALLVALPVGAWADDKSDCFKHHDDDARVRACSALIERNPNDALPITTAD
jgi:hypothetical protein